MSEVLPLTAHQRKQPRLRLSLATEPRKRAGAGQTLSRGSAAPEETARKQGTVLQQEPGLTPPDVWAHPPAMKR